MTRMRVLVTGGAGFIGSHVVEALLAAGHEVRVLDALLPAVHSTSPTLPVEAEVLAGDVRDAEAVEQALDNIEAVCHQAAMVGLGVDFDDAPDYVASNDWGTAVLLAGMARMGIRRLVLASSMVVYGEGRYECPNDGVVAPGPRTPSALRDGRFEPPCPRCGADLESGLVDETAAPDPRNVYAATKLAQEHLAAAFARATGARVAALRYHNVYGPRMPRNTPYAGVASLFRSSLAAGQPPKVFEDGAQRRDFVHVRDVAAANLAVLDAVSGPGPVEAGALRAYNVGSGTVRTVGELALALSRACGGPEPIVTGGFRLGDVRHITASSLRLRTELDWSPREDFDAGMAEFAAAAMRV
ncbi:NAD-dependent epimerase/dehydratase family protein [Sporichthya brevicatena]|uniref:NAD-dependent epimerase/dehydratase family protein n=2 Tax=Sporichthya brevicatena TaxID=171442 RepID=A0ABP3RB78_9ACTN